MVYAIAQSKALEELSLTEFNQFHSSIAEDVYPILSLDSCLAKRCAKGGVNLDRVAEAIQAAKINLEL